MLANCGKESGQFIDLMYHVTDFLETQLNIVDQEENVRASHVKFDELYSGLIGRYGRE